MNCKCKLCGSESSELVHQLNSKPEGETTYLPDGTIYNRAIRKCSNCGVYFNCHNYDIFSREFYEGSYNTAIDITGLERRFNKIISLPEASSDNKGRVKRIQTFLNNTNLGYNTRVLDVGSGTGVFPYEMANAGFLVSAVDPDPDSVAHMKKNLSLENVWNGSISDIPKDQFDFISFNKVLEHVEDPFSLIKEARKRLVPDGIIYIELPYGTELANQGKAPLRAEFFIEHHTTYTYSSFKYLGEKSDLLCLEMGHLIDPSGKHTIYGFFKNG